MLNALEYLYKFQNAIRKETRVVVMYKTIQKRIIIIMIANGLKTIKKRTKLNRKKAIAMFKEDYSYRQIQKALGYKSVWSVQYLLKNEIKKTNNAN